MKKKGKIQIFERVCIWFSVDYENYFHKTAQNQGKAIGLSYFKERGFTNETSEKFSLGYSPDTWDAFTKRRLGRL
jgi:DNA primase